MKKKNLNTKKSNNFLKLFIKLSLLITQAITDSKGPCAIKGATNPTTFTGIDNDPKKIELPLYRSESDLGFSLAFWVKITGIPPSGKRGIILKYPLTFRIFVENDSGTGKIRVKEENADPQIFGDYTVILNSWFLVWYEVVEQGGPEAHLIIRDLSSGQSSAISSSLGIFLKN